MSFEAFADAFARCPLVAILHGLRPGEAVAVGNALAEAGIGLIAVPLTAPAPLESIAALASSLAGMAVVGADMALTIRDVDMVRQAGGTMILSPNMRPAVIARTKAANLVSLPGVMTPTEAYDALEAGADGLVLGPSDLVGAAAARAVSGLLPRDTVLLVGGSATPDRVAGYRDAGVRGMAAGAALYVPGQPPEQVRTQAAAWVAAWVSAGPGCSSAYR